MEMEIDQVIYLMFFLKNYFEFQSYEKGFKISKRDIAFIIGSIILIIVGALTTVLALQQAQVNISF